MISKIDDLFKQNHGACEVKFVVQDSLSELHVTLPSKNVKVEPSLKLINSLKALNVEVELK
jgi:hypothetical protein